MVWLTSPLVHRLPDSVGCTGHRSEYAEIDLHYSNAPHSKIDITAPKPAVDNVPVPSLTGAVCPSKGIHVFSSCFPLLVSLVADQTLCTRD